MMFVARQRAVKFIFLRLLTLISYYVMYVPLPPNRVPVHDGELGVGVMQACGRWLS
jgi:hypothetical protein